MTLCFHLIKGHKLTVGTWGQEVTQKPWRNIAYWLAPHGLLSQIFLCHQGPPTQEWNVLHLTEASYWSLIQEISRDLYTDCLMETFSHSRLLFPNSSRFGPSWLKTNYGKSCKLSMTLLRCDLHITNNPLFSSELDFDA